MAVQQPFRAVDDLAAVWCDWAELEVNGEVFPKIVRDKCMNEFADDFFPVLVMVILRSNVPRLHSNLQVHRSWSHVIRPPLFPVSPASASAPPRTSHMHACKAV